MTTPMTRDDIVELMARAIAQSDGLDFDEVCGVDADPDEGYCDSGTCIAAHFEEHDADYARSIYRHQSTASLRALEAAGLQIVQGWLPIESAPKDWVPILVWAFSESEGEDAEDEEREPKRSIMVAHHSALQPGNWWLCGSPMTAVISPTHWMPLPAPPAGKVQP